MGQSELCCSAPIATGSGLRRKSRRPANAHARERCAPSSAEHQPEGDGDLCRVRRVPVMSPLPTSDVANVIAIVPDQKRGDRQLTRPRSRHCRRTGVCSREPAQLPGRVRVAVARTGEGASRSGRSAGSGRCSDARATSECERISATGRIATASPLRLASCRSELSVVCARPTSSRPRPRARASRRRVRAPRGRHRSRSRAARRPRRSRVHMARAI
jgi:hypothetical protein